MDDVIIIGAGVNGCFLARDLSKYKLNILVLEKGDDVDSEYHRKRRSRRQKRRRKRRITALRRSESSRIRRALPSRHFGKAGRHRRRFGAPYVGAGLLLFDGRHRSPSLRGAHLRA